MREREKDTGRGGQGWMEGETDRQTDRQTDGRTDGHKQRRTEGRHRETDRQRDTERGTLAEVDRDWGAGEERKSRVDPARQKGRKVKC